MNKTYEDSASSGSEKAVSAAPAKYGARWLEPSPKVLPKVSPEGNKRFERGLSNDGLQYRQPRLNAFNPKPWSKSLYTKHRTLNKDNNENRTKNYDVIEPLKSPVTGNSYKTFTPDVEEFDQFYGMPPRRVISVPEGKVSASRQLFDKEFNAAKLNGSWKEHSMKEPLFKVPHSLKPGSKASVRIKDKEGTNYHSNTFDPTRSSTKPFNNVRPGSENSFFNQISDHNKKKVDKVSTSSNIKVSSSIQPNASIRTLSSLASDESGIIIKSISCNKIEEEKCAALKCWSSEKETTRHFFAHFDWQSMTFNFKDAKLATDTLKRKNITTGASKAAAAKLQSAENSPANSLENLSFIGTENENQQASNDMLLWCPYFLTELGGECCNKDIQISEGGKAESFHWVRSENTSHSVTNSPTQAHMLLANHKGLSVMEKSGIEGEKMLNAVGFVMEHVDRGALYYRTHFVNQEHQNYFGMDEEYGPVAISLKRERVREVNQNNNKDNIWQYRLIVRTSELCTLRGSILEDVLLSQNNPAGRGLRPRDVLEYACPEIDIDCLKIAQATDAVQNQLTKVDEQNVSNMYKIGVMYCKKGQNTEEEMYNNIDGSPALEEFLDLLGDKIQLKGFTKFRGGLDVKTNSTGRESYFTTFQGNEIMFHVSTLLPHSKNNRQQLLRKRHVGNDIVTIVFQEPDSKPFSPETIRSHFQHIFIVVRVYQPCSANTCYRIAQTRYQDIPDSSPLIPKQAMFPKSETFREFLLTKIINNENAARNAGKFKAMAMNTRQEYLRDLAVNHCTINPVDAGAKFTKFSLSVASRRREKGKNKISPEINCNGAIVWHVVLKDCGPNDIPCMLGISDYVLALVEKSSKKLLFSIPCQAIIGWSEYSANLLHIYYGKGDRLSICAPSCAACSWKKEVISRLQEFTVGDTAVTQNLRRNSKRQLGFHVNYEGIVMDVEQKGSTLQQGKLNRGCRLVEICKILVVTMSHEEMLDLLRTSDVVNVIMIPPHDDGTPRRCSKSLYHISPIVKVFEMNTYLSRIEDNLSHIRSRSDPATKTKKSFVMSSEDLHMQSDRPHSHAKSSQHGTAIQSDSEYVTARKQINFNNLPTPSSARPIPRQMRRQQSYDVVDSKMAMSYSLNTNKSNNEANSFTVPQKRNKDKGRTPNIKHSTSTESGLNIVGVTPTTRHDLIAERLNPRNPTVKQSHYINHKLHTYVKEKHKKSNGSVSTHWKERESSYTTRAENNHRKFNQRNRSNKKKLTRAMSDESICGAVVPKVKQRNHRHSRHGTSDDVPIVDRVDNWDQLVNLASRIDERFPSSELKQHSSHDFHNGNQNAASDYYSENDFSEKTNTLSSRSISPFLADNISEDFHPMDNFSRPQSTEAEERLRQIEQTLKAIQNQLSEEKKSKQIILKEVEKLRKENSRLQNQALKTARGPTYF